MLTEADFDGAYNHLIQKWTPILGQDKMKELVNDVAPAVQSLLHKTAEHQQTAGAAKEHTDIIHHGIATFESWKGKHHF